MVFCLISLRTGHTRRHATHARFGKTVAQTQAQCGPLACSPHTHSAGWAAFVLATVTICLSNPHSHTQIVGVPHCHIVNKMSRRDSVLLMQYWAKSNTMRSIWRNAPFKSLSGLASRWLGHSRNLLMIHPNTSKQSASILLLWCTVGGEETERKVAVQQRRQGV